MFANARRINACQRLLQGLDRDIKQRKDDAYSTLFQSDSTQQPRLPQLSHAQWYKHSQIQFMDQELIRCLQQVEKILPKPVAESNTWLSEAQMATHLESLLPYIAKLSKLAETNAQFAGINDVEAHAWDKLMYDSLFRWILHRVHAFRQQSKKHKKHFDQRYVIPTQAPATEPDPDRVIVRNTAPSKRKDDNVGLAIFRDPELDSVATSDAVMDDTYLESVPGMGFFEDQPTPA